MGSTLSAIATLVGLAAWHLRVRRHTNWRSSNDGRYYITLAYPAVAIAVYWLAQSATGTDWMWALGCLWALVAMVSFVYGFQELNTPVGEPSAEPATVEQRVQRSDARDITTR
jgi:ABC-type Fe3+ transport system permease subunit